MIAARGITKRYPGVTALAGVDFTVRPGEVVGLVGENGAGKSTLIKILGGLTTPDGGEIEVDGQTVKISGAREATQLGIGIIHQELCNLDNLDIAANVLLGREPRTFGFLVDARKAEELTQSILARVGLDVSPRTALGTLSIAQQQMVEIAKALSLHAKVLIMDEPTSSLTAAETATLMSIVEELREQGVGVVYVSHRLSEVQRLADRVVVLRDGKNAGELAREEVSPEAMVRLMVGREIVRDNVKSPTLGKVRLAVRDLRTRRFPGSPVSFDVHAGEIVALAGLVGAGRTEVVRALFGVDPRVGGTVELDGVEVPSAKPRAAIDRGLLLAPEDRRREGLVTSFSIRENVTLPRLDRFASMGLVSRHRESKAADAMRDRLRVKAPSVESITRDLSGGNQQKVVLAKWLALEPKCLVVDEPTRGIDVGARQEIYGLLRNLAESGVAILVVSSDMEEVLALGDRVVVMHEGRLAGELARIEANEESVMELAVGHA